MATFDFRILLETMEGVKTSYLSQSFVDTSVDLVLSSSQVYNRITGSVSCSYQNSSFFSGSVPLSSNDINTNFTFKDNLLLSASLSGSTDFGFIKFDALDTEYDRLKRYKFIGEKVCQTLGLPNEQWIYVDQARFPADDELNYFEGNVNANTIYISDKMTFSPTSNINSHINFYNDTGSDRYIRFLDERPDQGNKQHIGLFMGYNKSTDKYEIGSELLGQAYNHQGFILRGVTSISSSLPDFAGDSLGTTISLGCNVVAVNGAPTNGSEMRLLDRGDSDKKFRFILSGNGAGTIQLTKDDQDLKLRTDDFNNAVYIKDSTERVGIGTSSPDAKLHVAGNLKVDGEIEATSITSSRVTSSVIYASGSNQFGDTIADTHLFNGHITASGNISASGTGSFANVIVGGTNNNSHHKLDVTGNVGISEDLHLRSNKKITWSHGDAAIEEGTNVGSAFCLGFRTFDGSSNSLALLLEGDNGAKFTGNITASGNISASGYVHIGNGTGYTGGKGLIFGQEDSDANQINLTSLAGQLTFSSGSHNKGVFVKMKSEEKRLIVGSVFKPIELDGRGGHITASGNISASGEVSANTIVVGSTITHIGDSNTKITFSDDDINLTAAGKTAIDITYDGDGGGDTREITFNEGHADIDVRIEGDTDANLFFTNAGTERVGIGTNSPSSKLQVNGDITTTHITASTNISASGTIFGKQHYFTHHNFNGTTHKMFLPINSTSDGDSITEVRKWLAPYNGELKKLLYRSEETVGNNSASLHINGTVAGTSDTVNMNSANTTFTLTFSSNNSFNAGDELSVSVDPASDTNDTNITCVWLYTIGE